MPTQLLKVKIRQLHLLGAMPLLRKDVAYWLRVGLRIDCVTGSVLLLLGFPVLVKDVERASLCRLLLGLFQLVKFLVLFDIFKEGIAQTFALDHVIGL